MEDHAQWYSRIPLITSTLKTFKRLECERVFQDFATNMDEDSDELGILDNDEKMEPPGTVEQLPVEILQEIFSNLSCKDLGRCSRVCFKWREIINRNIFWAQICRSEGIIDKEFLRSSESMFINPTKAFRRLEYGIDRIQPECKWKTHLKKYKFLEKNWRRGNFAGFQLPQVISYYKDGIFLKIGSDNLNVYFAKDLLEDGYVINHRIKFQHPTLNIERIFIQNRFIFYVQSVNIVCLGLEGKTYESRYDIKVQNTDCSHIHNVDNYEELIIQATEDFLIVLDRYKPCKIFFYDIKTGCLDRKIDVTYNKTCPIVQCLAANNKQLYIGYTLKNGCHFVSEYDFNTNKWIWSCEFDYPCLDIIASKEYTTIKLPSASQEAEKECELHTYSANKNEIPLVRPAAKRVNSLLADPYIVYCSDEDMIRVHNLTDASDDIAFRCEHKINSFMHIMGSLLLIDTNAAVQLYDWRTKSKLQTYVNSKVLNIWCDSKKIVWNRTTDMSTYVLSFW